MDAYERGFEGYTDDAPNWKKEKSFQKYATETIDMPSDDEVQANRDRRRLQLEEFERRKQADEKEAEESGKGGNFSTGPVPELHPFLDSKGENKVVQLLTHHADVRTSPRLLHLGSLEWCLQDPEVIKERLNRRRLSG